MLPFTEDLKVALGVTLAGGFLALAANEVLKREAVINPKLEALASKVRTTLQNNHVVKALTHSR